MFFTAALALSASLSALSPDSAQSRDSLRIPFGRSVLLDGNVRPAEWADARVVQLSSGARLLLKHDSTYLYVAVAPSAPRIFGLNLYIAPNEGAAPYLNLHASAKLGERWGRSGAWPDWQWWNNRDWSANVVRFNAFEEPRFLPEVGKEVQIAITRLPGSRFRLALDVETATGTELPLDQGAIADGMRWLTLQLAP